MKSVLSTLALGICVSLHAADAPATKPSGGANTNSTSSASSQFKTAEEKLGYSFGVQMGNGLRMNNIPINPDLVVQGVRDGLANQAKMTDQEVREVQESFRREFMAKREQERKQQGEKNKAEGEKWLAENAKKEGVKTTPSGLQYKVLTEGTGKMPASNEVVTVHYRGKLIDGTEFDSSHKNNQPATFGVGGVIRGWTEALQMMKVGSKWELYIPPQLAYGETGNARIQPNSVLIFEVELLEAKTPEPPKPVTSDIIKVPSKAELDAGAKIEVIKPEELERLQKQQQQQKNAQPK